MKIICISDKIIPCYDNDVVNDEIHIFTQFFIPSALTRQVEIKACLLRNCKNPFITTIHLLNERLYSQTEMGCSNETFPKIKQHVINKRLSYRNVFSYIRENHIHGFLVITNADIFFDSTIGQLNKSSLPRLKSFMCQLRYEYRGGSEHNSVLFGPRFDSQDTWIHHSNFSITESQEKAFGFELGRPGCDNKLIYLLRVLGYKLYNDPEFIKTYHNHSSQTREYTIQDLVHEPWGILCPSGIPPHTLPSSLGVNLEQIYQTGQNLWFEDQDILHDYVAQCITEGRKFIIPRIAGIENNIAVLAKMANIQSQNTQAYLRNVIPIMKTNAGIQISGVDSMKSYSSLYLKSFENCELFFGWELQGNYIHHILQSYDYMKKSYANRRIIWALCLDIFHYIHSRPWTWSLRGKRILIVSPFQDSILEKIPIRHLLWGDSGVDLFPDCSFVTILPPMTQAQEPSKEFDIELETFYKRLDELKDSYDIALVSSGGYGNIICNYIYENHNKSSIYVGGVLQMYFGILGSRWLKERPDIMRLYLNNYWSRPKTGERPQGCDQIEDGCYW
jgi:hypothetical protein